jgi:hypothetical protein
MLTKITAAGYVCIHARARRHTNTRTRTQAQTHTHTHTCTHTCTHTHTHTHTHRCSLSALCAAYIAVSDVALDGVVAAFVHFTVVWMPVYRTKPSKLN